MWRHVEIVLTNVSEEHIISIFRVEDKKKSASEPAEQVQETPAKRQLTQFLHSFLHM
jgi:hypothetical protein